jgi:hypothetical protein
MKAYEVIQPDRSDPHNWSIRSIDEDGSKDWLNLKFPTREAAEAHIPILERRDAEAG